MTQTAPEIDTYEVDRNTHFLFEHKVFSLKGAHFALTDDGSTPAFHVELGTLVASLPLAKLRHEFSIDRDSPDGALLAIVEKSLRFVQEIRPGDSIPRELLDGSASWSVEERHRMRAKAHLWAKAIQTDETNGAKDEGLSAFLAKPDTETRLKNAATAIGKKLGYEMSGESVLARLDDLARELAYMEALQERCSEISAMVPKVNQLSRIYRSDRGVVDELSRIRTLLLKPIELYDEVFVRLNARHDNVTEAIENFHERVEFIRQQRDDMHQAMMMWDPILKGWRTIDLTRCTETEHRISELYRFIARNFLNAPGWQQGT